jgi:2,5-diamino-6-(ribosylamino)-4(3H)-pyrimidinone 5'-phosphate reductase
LDRKPHLNEKGIRYLAQRVGKLFIITNNPEHPALSLGSYHENIEVIFYPEEVDFHDLFVQVKQKYGIEHLIIESGGTLNSVLVRQGLIDHVLIIVAPLLVGGSRTSSLMDGLSLQAEDELVNLKALKLARCEVLEDSYLRLEYDVINETEIEPVVS